MIFCFSFLFSQIKKSNQIYKNIPLYGMTTSRDNNMHNPKKPKLVATHEQMIKKNSKQVKQRIKAKQKQKQR